MEVSNSAVDTSSYNTVAASINISTPKTCTVDTNATTITTAKNLQQQQKQLNNNKVRSSSSSSKNQNHPRGGRRIGVGVGVGFCDAVSACSSSTSSSSVSEEDDDNSIVLCTNNNNNNNNNNSRTQQQRERSRSSSRRSTANNHQPRRCSASLPEHEPGIGCNFFSFFDVAAINNHGMSIPSILQPKASSYYTKMPAVFDLKKEMKRNSTMLEAVETELQHEHQQQQERKSSITAEVVVPLPSLSSHQRVQKQHRGNNNEIIDDQSNHEEFECVSTLSSPQQQQRKPETSEADSAAALSVYSDENLNDDSNLTTYYEMPTKQQQQKKKKKKNILKAAVKRIVHGGGKKSTNSNSSNSVVDHQIHAFGRSNKRTTVVIPSPSAEASTIETNPPPISTDMDSSFRDHHETIVSFRHYHEQQQLLLQSHVNQQKQFLNNIIDYTATTRNVPANQQEKHQGCQQQIQQSMQEEISRLQNTLVKSMSLMQEHIQITQQQLDHVRLLPVNVVATSTGRNQNFALKDVDKQQQEQRHQEHDDYRKRHSLMDDSCNSNNSLQAIDSEWLTTTATNTTTTASSSATSLSLNHHQNVVVHDNGKPPLLQHRARAISYDAAGLTIDINGDDNSSISTCRSSPLTATASAGGTPYSTNTANDSKSFASSEVSRTSRIFKTSGGANKPNEKKGILRKKAFSMFGKNRKKKCNDNEDDAPNLSFSTFGSVGSGAAADAAKNTRKQRSHSFTSVGNDSCNSATPKWKKKPKFKMMRSRSSSKQSKGSIAANNSSTLHDNTELDCAPGVVSFASSQDEDDGCVVDMTNEATMETAAEPLSIHGKHNLTILSSSLTISSTASSTGTETEIMSAKKSAPSPICTATTNDTCGSIYSYNDGSEEFNVSNADQAIIKSNLRYECEVFPYMRHQDLDLKLFDDDDSNHNHNHSQTNSTPATPMTTDVRIDPDFVRLEKYEMGRTLNSLYDFAYQMVMDGEGNGQLFTPTRDTERFLTRQQNQVEFNDGNTDPNWPVHPWHTVHHKTSSGSSKTNYNKTVLLWLGNYNQMKKNQCQVKTLLSPSSSHSFAGNDWPMIKARGLVPTSAKNLFDFLWESKNVKLYNNISLGRDDVHIWEDDVFHSDDSEGGFNGCMKVTKSVNKHRLFPKAIELAILALGKPISFGGNDDDNGSNNDKNIGGGGKSFMMLNRSVWEEDLVIADRPNRASVDPNTLRSEMIIGINVFRHIDENMCEMTVISHLYSPGIPEMIAKRTAPMSVGNMIRDLQNIFSK